MDKNVSAAIQQVQRTAEAIDDSTTNLDAWIASDGPADSKPQPRKREKQSADELKQELEREFLTPSTRFSTQWLNRLQRYVPLSHNYFNVFLWLSDGCWISPFMGENIIDLTLLLPTFPPLP